ncbi:MAG TPA: polynucleotide kinase-phosphatase [Candidatus Tectomicrobia bacterium]
MQLTLPDFCLVVLIGPSGAGKTHFARAHFTPTEVIASDTCRALVSDNETDQDATADAFELLRFIATKRLAARRLTVIDATNVRREDRASLLALARMYHALAVAIVFNLPDTLCQERNRQRPERAFGRQVIRRQAQHLRQSLRGLQREGFRFVYTFTTPEEVEAATIARQPLWPDRRAEHGPFDIIGDIHGCFDELGALLTRLGYTMAVEADATGVPLYRVTPPAGRRVVFLGDLVDRGPRVPDVLRVAMAMTAAGSALCVPGNHEVKLLRALRGHQVQLSHGLAESLHQIAAEPTVFTEQVIAFLESLVSHYVLDDGRLVVAHAGMPAAMQGRASGAVRAFALYGETTGETDEFGLPIRYNWAADYRGQALVAYGHTPVPETEWLNNTICLDTGCVFGGKLTALRYPEKELVSVPAAQIYCAPIRPLQPAPVAAETRSAQQVHDDLLDIADVQGKRQLATRLHPPITVRAEQAAAALEVMSRFAINPQWLIYLPPTMAPTATSSRPGLLEHPEEAFAAFARQGVPQVLCEEKHMGSRAVVIVCRNAEAARRRFGVTDDSAGVVYTRTGRRFFTDPAMETALLDRLRGAVERCGWWDMFATDWLCLDGELLPWSAKAEPLLREQYAPVGVAAQVGLAAAVEALTQAAQAGVEVGAVLEHYTSRQHLAQAYVEAYRRYCWPVASIDDIQFAPFHLLATEGAVHTDKDHGWHLATLAELCGADAGLLRATSSTLVDLDDAASQHRAIAWWEHLTAHGGEGMVVKPLAFVCTGRRGLVQPALKCRGTEYLRIIYGPEYTAPEHLARLRARGLGRKRALARQEFVLGLEGLWRFVYHEPLRCVHECVFGVLALESEPVDPRL